MSGLALAASFPVRYVQEHNYDMTRGEWGMLTGLPVSAPADDLVAAHEEVVRKSLQRGLHKGLLWQPEPEIHDFPTQVQAKLMDELADRESRSIPIEVVELVEDEDGIRATYLVVVTEEQLIEEENRIVDGVTPVPPPVKVAALPMGPFVVGAGLGATMGWFIVPKGFTTKLISAVVVGLFSGVAISFMAGKTK